MNWCTCANMFSMPPPPSSVLFCSPISASLCWSFLDLVFYFSIYPSLLLTDAAFSAMFIHGRYIDYAAVALGLCVRVSADTKTPLTLLYVSDDDALGLLLPEENCF